MTQVSFNNLLRFAALSTVLLFASCITIDIELPANRFCESPDLLVDSNFEGGNFHNCSLTDDGDVVVFIRPENTPINPSPWYSFRVRPKRSVETEILVHFIEGYARYWPKVSTDSINWTPMPEGAVRIDEDGTAMQITLQLSQTPMWISAQELILPSFYDQLIRRLSVHPEITTQTLGHSVEGRPIQVAETRSRPEAIILLGRQHPPEVTGARAM